VIEKELNMARRFTIDDWQQRLNKLNQPLLIVGKYKQGKKEIFTLQCYKCGVSFEADRLSLFTACNLREKGKYQTNWCPICNKKKIRRGINDVATLRKDLIKYFDNPNDAEKYGIGSHARVKLRCPICNQPKTLQVCDLCSKGFHCDYCNDNVSLGEKIIRNLILQLPIEEYDFEFTDSWTQNKRYDCYFMYDNKKYLIEVDGEQHIKNTSWSSKEWQNQNDLFKTKLALDNGFYLIRVKAYKTDFDYIKQSVLESELSEIFDLSKIDWNVICKQTVTSRNVEIAKYYKEHEDMMLKDIAEHFHISYPTLTSTLRKMTQLGICDYSKEKAFKNGRVQCGKNRAEKNKIRKMR
jgi:very-short-patch-repair endonuclease